MNILPINNSIINSVTYVLYREDVDYCVLIDCGERGTLKPVIERIGKSVKAVLLTHGHSDHIYGLVGLLQMCPEAEVYTTEYGHLELQSDRKNLSFYHGYPFTVMGYHQKTLIGGEVLHFEGLTDVEVIATPSHSPSCLIKFQVPWFQSSMASKVYCSPEMLISRELMYSQNFPKQISN